MKAKYIIVIDNDSIEFKAKAMSYKKCLQLDRILRSGKKIKGFDIIELIYSISGLRSLHINKRTSDFKRPNHFNCTVEHSALGSFCIDHGVLLSRNDSLIQKI